MIVRPTWSGCDGQMVLHVQTVAARSLGVRRGGLLHCQGCNRQVSVTAGTVFEDSRKPLRLWFHVMWLMMAQKTGLSARNLCDTYGFGSYQTAWGWLQKLRSVMIRTGREPLVGRVEVDEAYVGGQREGKRGRGAEGKALVLIAVEGDEQKKLGRVRFRCVASIDRETVESFVRDYVALGATVISDGLSVYDKLGAAGFDHCPHLTSTEVRPHRNNWTMFIWSSPCSSAGWVPRTRVP
jgi:transposase-like protein